MTLLPFALLAGREWRAIGGGIASSLALLGLGLLPFGVAGYSSFLSILPQFSQWLSVGRWPWGELASTLALLSWFGVPKAIALVVSGVRCPFAGAALTARAWALKSEQRAEILAAATLLVPPYLFTYDALLLTLPLAWLARKQERQAEFIGRLDSRLIAGDCLLQAVSQHDPAGGDARFMGASPAAGSQCRCGRCSALTRCRQGPRADPLVRASALRHDRRAFEVADEARILAKAEDREAVEQIAGDRLVEEQAGLPVLHAAAGIEYRQRAAGRARIRRSDAEIIIGITVADEFGADAEARVGLARQRRRKVDVGPSTSICARSRYRGARRAEARACHRDWSGRGS